jgi:hypothetical protein
MSSPSFPSTATITGGGDVKFTNKQQPDVPVDREEEGDGGRRLGEGGRRKAGMKKPRGVRGVRDETRRGAVVSVPLLGLKQSQQQPRRARTTFTTYQLHQLELVWFWHHFYMKKIK